MIKKGILISLLLTLNSCATNANNMEAFPLKKTLDEKIGSMLMVGFMGTSAPKNSQICKDIRTYNLAGVILFDVNPVNHKQAKNISSKHQVARLTQQLQAVQKMENFLFL